MGLQRVVAKYGSPTIAHKYEVLVVRIVCYIICMNVKEMRWTRIPIDFILAVGIIPTFLIFCFLSITSGMPYHDFLMEASSNPTTGAQILITTIVGQSGILLLPLYYKFRKDLPEHAFQASFSKLKKHAAIIAVTFIGILAIDLLYDFFLKKLGIMIPTQITLMDRSAASFLFLFVGGVLIGPVAEELFFRGYFLPLLLTKSKQHMALFISSVLFAVLHFHLLYLPTLLLAGYVYGYLYLKTKNIYVPIVLHVLANAAAFTLTYLGKQ